MIPNFPFPNPFGNHLLTALVLAWLRARGEALVVPRNSEEI
jgi:hypothetical protein